MKTYDLSTCIQQGGVFPARQRRYPKRHSNRALLIMGVVLAATSLLLMSAIWNGARGDHAETERLLKLKGLDQ